MPTSRSGTFSARLPLVALALVALIGSTLYLLPAASLRYIGIYFAVVGFFNLVVLPLFYSLSYSRFELVPLDTSEL